MPTTTYLMKMTIKSLLIALSSLFFAFGAQASTQLPDNRVEQQQRPQHPPRPGDGSNRFSPAQFSKELGDFITREAGMSSAEAKEFLPIYFEMKEKQRAIEHQKARTINTASNSNMTDKDCKRALSQISELDKKSHRIEAQYQQRLERIVGARKLVKAYKADRDFGRRLFKKMTR